MRKLKLAELNRLSVESYKEAEKWPIVLLLDSVRSALNVGSIFRTADAMGLEGVALCGITAQPPHREITKTAIGATRSVAWTHYQDIRDAIQHYKDQGYQMVALEQTDVSKKLPQDDLHGPIALVVGNEVSGISNEALALCDLAIEIPQFGTKHSLNVSVSTGIAVWEIVRGLV